MTLLCNIFDHKWVRYSKLIPSERRQPGHVPFSLRYCLRKCGAHQVLLFQDWGDIPTYGQEAKDFVVGGLTA